MASSGRLVLLLVASVLCVMGGEAKVLPEDTGKFVYTCNINACCIYGELGLLL